MGVLKWGLKATLCNYAQPSAIVHIRGLLSRNFSSQMPTIVGNHGQSWTSTLSPHLLSPHLDFPQKFQLFSTFSTLFQLRLNFWTPGTEGPGSSFSNLFSTSGLKGPKIEFLWGD